MRLFANKDDLHGMSLNEMTEGSNIEQRHV